MAATDLRDAEERSAREAAQGGRDKRAYVQAMFSRIAPRYDLLNHLLSLNIDRRWRTRAIRALGWERNPGGTYLDVCAGTLDVAVELSRASGFVGRVIGADFAEPMLRAGRRKARGQPVDPVTADAVALPFRDGTIAGAVVAFGARNLADLDAGLREIARVLVPGGRYVILEFSTPRLAVIRWAYHLYFHHLLPRIGGWISGNRSAYRYLPASVANFPSPDVLTERMRLAGFTGVRWESLTLGVAAIHVGAKA